jgi:hypothetical protein
MQVIYCNLCALAVATIFYSWREYQSRHDRRERVLRERVAYMLWVVAHGGGH